jgi:hypothetical protein
MADWSRFNLPKDLRQYGGLSFKQRLKLQLLTLAVLVVLLIVLSYV